MVLKIFGPPSSPPTAAFLLRSRMKMARPASMQKIVTENPRLKLKYFRKYILTGTLSFFTIFFKKYIFFLFTCQQEHRMSAPAPPSRLQPWSRRYQYRGRHWQRWNRWRFQQSCQQFHPQWQRSWKRKYLKEKINQKRNNFKLCKVFLELEQTWRSFFSFS